MPFMLFANVSGPIQHLLLLVEVASLQQLPLREFEEWTVIPLMLKEQFRAGIVLLCV